MTSLPSSNFNKQESQFRCKSSRSHNLESSSLPTDYEELRANYSLSYNSHFCRLFSHSDILANSALGTPLQNAGYESQTIGRKLPIEDNHCPSETLIGDRQEQ